MQKSASSANAARLSFVMVSGASLFDSLGVSIFADFVYNGAATSATTRTEASCL
jgi:hypothetical protein